MCNGEFPMAQKNETTVLILALLTTAGLLAGGLWWFSQRSGIGLDNLLSPTAEGGDNGERQQDPSGAAQPNQPIVETLAAVQNVPSGLFNYGGSTSWAPVRGDVDPIIQNVWPKFQLRYTEPPNATPGSGSGIRLLLNNQLAFAQSSRSLNNEEYSSAQQRGFSLKEIPVAIEGIAIAVNPNLNISGLTLSQVKDIYTGKISNWNQVGGPNQPITPYSRRVEDGGTVEFFVENVLADQRLGSNVEYVPSTTRALRELANDPGGIYYASIPEVVGQCGVKPLPIGRQANELIPPYKLPYVPPSECPSRRNEINREAIRSGTYPLTRQLFVIVKQNGQVDEQAGEAYANLLLTDQGQELIAKSGFIRIR
jgi:phosphate transport system substrate-binding protein